MLNVKEGVQPPLIWLIAAVSRVASKRGKAITITSGTDGAHSKNSLHYSLRALDLRISDQDDVPKLVEALKVELGPKYDVVLETDHIHIELDPK